ncbi:hypothetical protein AADG42_10620 [Ammonicoccus fulvus]|uniref:Oxaloacetate decarboxylase, gamma chain n=1 Tax=Ammonicoccus fulvus TaxID=3138240 RepID=A0ABZ3FSQ0_9ACTN
MTDIVMQTLIVFGLLVGVSMVVAVVIQGIVVAMGRSADRRERTRKSATAPQTDPVTAGGPPPEHVAAIAAAVSVVFDDGHIVHIEPVRQDTSWTASGRQAHHSSHHPGPRTTRRPGPQPRHQPPSPPRESR